MSARPERFDAAVALYGFVANRFMTFEGGDFTWESEYIGDPKRWPLSANAQASDTFESLCRIRGPTLLMHGEADGICMLSQSRVAYHVLASEGTPTQLVVYPGEGHGFKRPACRRDRDWRMLRWFLAHLPPAAGAAAHAGSPCP